MKLGIVIKKYRLMTEQNLRTLSKDIGISVATLMRLEHGYDIDIRTFKRILDWLMQRKAAEK